MFWFRFLHNVLGVLFITFQYPVELNLGGVGDHDVTQVLHQLLTQLARYVTVKQTNHTIITTKLGDIESQC